MSGESILQTLIALLESQEQIKITAVIKENKTTEKEELYGETF